MSPETNLFILISAWILLLGFFDFCLILPHELCHWIAASIVGVDVCGILVGDGKPFLHCKLGSTILIIANNGLGGSTYIASSKEDISHFKWIFMYSAGLILHFCLALLSAIYIYINWGNMEGFSVTSLIAVFGLANLISFFVNGIPRKGESFSNDGWWLWMIWREKECPAVALQINLEFYSHIERYIELGSYKVALKIAESFSKYSVEYEQMAIFWKGLIAYYQFNMNEAISYWTPLLQKTTGFFSLRIYILLTLSYLHRRDTCDVERAIDTAKDGLSRYQKSSELQGILACAEIENGKSDGSSKTLGEIMLGGKCEIKKPTEVLMCIYLAYALLKDGDTDLYQQYIDIAVEHEHLLCKTDYSLYDRIYAQIPQNIPQDPGDLNNLPQHEFD